MHEDKFHIKFEYNRHPIAFFFLIAIKYNFTIEWTYMKIVIHANEQKNWNSSNTPVAYVLQAGVDVSNTENKDLVLESSYTFLGIGPRVIGHPVWHCNFIQFKIENYSTLFTTKEVNELR